MVYCVYELTKQNKPSAFITSIMKRVYLVTNNFLLPTLPLPKFRLQINLEQRQNCWAQATQLLGRVVSMLCQSQDLVAPSPVVSSHSYKGKSVCFAMLSQ